MAVYRLESFQHIRISIKENKRVFGISGATFEFSKAHELSAGSGSMITCEVALFG